MQDLESEIREVTSSDSAVDTISRANGTTVKALPAVRVGELTGRLATHLSDISAASLSDPQPMTQNFVLGANGVSSLSDEEKAVVKQAYDAGKSITVLHPSNADIIAAAFSFLHGVGQPSPCADPVEIIDAWIVQRDSNGGFRQTTLAVPLRQAPMRAVTQNLSAEPAQAGNWTRDETDIGNAHQVSQLAAVLHDAEARWPAADLNKAPVATARLLNASIDPVDFMKEVQNVTDVFTQSHYVDGQGSPSTYTVTNIAIPVSCLDSSNNLWDYYYLAHQAVFSCGDAPATMRWYDFNVWSEQSGDVAPVVIVSSPSTTEGETTTTSSTSVTVSGNIGFQGAALGGGIGVSGTWGKEVSYSSPDVATENKSDSSHVMWTYYLHNTIAHTTFQPYMQEVFRLTRSPEASQVSSPFKTLAKIVPNSNPEGIWIEHWFNAPIPPAPHSN